MELEVFERYPGFIFSRVTYRNPQRTRSPLSPGPTATICCTPTRRDRLLVLLRGARMRIAAIGCSRSKRVSCRTIILGMEASDYGSGIPVVDVWRRDGGLAVGHVEDHPKRISLPVQELQGSVRLAACSQEKFTLAAGGDFKTIETFVAVHERRLLLHVEYLSADHGGARIALARRGPACYEPIWCAWGYERDCTTAVDRRHAAEGEGTGLDVGRASMMAGSRTYRRLETRTPRSIRAARPT